MQILLLIVGFLLWPALGLPYSGITRDPVWEMVPDEELGWKLVNITEDPEPEHFYNAQNDMILTLFSKTGTTINSQVISWSDSSWVTSPTVFQPSQPIRVIIHGWNGGPDSPVNPSVTAALFAIGNFNVIQVDCSVGAGTINYVSAANRIPATAAVIRDLLEMMTEASNVDHSTTTLIGHSLGAHVAGFVGKTLNVPLGNIVGLDCALPMFSDKDSGNRLHSTDAIYVESIHTDAGRTGFYTPIGQASFYPNWGRPQPGCGMDLVGSCGHGRAHQLYSESILSADGFWARQCSDHSAITGRNCPANPGIGYTKMGGEPLNSVGKTGVFYLATNSASPFAQGVM